MKLSPDRQTQDSSTRLSVSTVSSTRSLRHLFPLFFWRQPSTSPHSPKKYRRIWKVQPDRTEGSLQRVEGSFGPQKGKNIEGRRVKRAESYVCGEVGGGRLWDKWGIKIRVYIPLEGLGDNCNNGRNFTVFVHLLTTRVLSPSFWVVFIKGSHSARVSSLSRGSIKVLVNRQSPFTVVEGFKSGQEGCHR